MVLQIGAYSGNMCYSFNAQLIEQRPIADAGQLQDLGRMYAACCHDGLLPDVDGGALGI